ncbi:hypothetical protein VULLAG_LOCUS12205 [Vulpes lagopus]
MKEKRYSLIGTRKDIEHLEIYCLHYAAGSRSTCYVFISFSPEEIGNPSAYRGQAENFENTESNEENISHSYSCYPETTTEK